VGVSSVLLLLASTSWVLKDQMGARSKRGGKGKTKKSHSLKILGGASVPGSRFMRWGQSLGGSNSHINITYSSQTEKMTEIVLGVAGELNFNVYFLKSSQSV